MIAAAACGNSTGLPSAGFPNYVDTAMLYALTGTPIGTPSGYDITVQMVSYPEQGATFDFAFDITEDGVAQVLPAKLLGRTTVAGIQAAETSFDSIREAPLDGYVTDTAFTVANGTTFLARSRAYSNNCGYVSALPRYGKFRVLAIDEATRTVTLEAMVDWNCGYRQLEPGVPTN